MKKVIILLLVILLPIVSTYGQTPAISKLENRIEELEQRVLVLENMILNNGTNVIQNDSTYANAISNWRILKIGMKDEDIRNILGEPNRITRRSRMLYVWEYETASGTGYVRFDDRGVYSWNEPD